HETAAAIAFDKPTGDADDIDDCDGDTFYACVDLQGDEEYEQSRWIDYEPERERQAASKLLAALEACEWQLREYVRWHHANAGGGSVEIESAWEQARDAFAEANAAAIQPQPFSPRLLHALQAVLPYAESEAESLYECWKRDGDLQIKDASDRCERV